MLVDRSKQQSNLLCSMCGGNSFRWGLIREHSRLEFVQGENFWGKLKNLTAKSCAAVVATTVAISSFLFKSGFKTPEWYRFSSTAFYT
jgi:hypothetical protein